MGCLKHKAWYKHKVFWSTRRRISGFSFPLFPLLSHSLSHSLIFTFSPFLISYKNIVAPVEQRDLNCEGGSFPSFHRPSKNSSAIVDEEESSEKGPREKESSEKESSERESSERESSEDRKKFRRIFPHFSSCKVSDQLSRKKSDTVVKGTQMEAINR